MIKALVVGGLIGFVVQGTAYGAAAGALLAVGTYYVLVLLLVVIVVALGD